MEVRVGQCCLAFLFGGVLVQFEILVVEGLEYAVYAVDVFWPDDQILMRLVDAVERRSETCGQPY